MIGKIFRNIARFRNSVLGVNARNLDFIYRLNPRRNFPNVDDKLKAKSLLKAHSIPVPRTLAVFESRRDLLRLEELIPPEKGFALKPARGAGGKGILIVRRGKEGELRTAGSKGEIPLSLEELREHIELILSGVFSLEAPGDRAFFEELLEAEPTLSSLAYKGLPDLRVIVCKREPAMAMLRVPVRASRGKANLHQGGLGIGVDLATGRTTGGVLGGRLLERHPDTDRPLRGIRLPEWDRLLELSTKAASSTGLEFVGVDLTVDVRRGPLVIEVNARPGLSIQLANACGLLSRLPVGDRR